MGRPVKIRTSYRNDASFLLRFEEAIAKDTRQTPSWRVGTNRLVRKLALRLLEADARLGTKSSDLLGEIGSRSATIAKKRTKRVAAEVA
jgi:hypothetical protein